MNAKLLIKHNEMSKEDIQDITFDMMKNINQETDLIANMPEEVGGVGTKGDAVMIGQLLLTALSSGTVVAMFQVLKSYMERKPTLRIEIEGVDGRKMRIEAEQLKSGQFEETIKIAKQFCGA